MHKHYKTDIAKIDAEIESLSKKYSSIHSREYIRQLFTTVIKLYLEEADEHDLYLANVTLKELRHIFRIFSPYRSVKKVDIFGSHRTPPDSQEYKMALEFAQKIVAKDFMVITGGGGGVMEAGNCGAGKEGFAIKIQLPLEMRPNPFVCKGEKLINVNYFFTRKLAFIKESDATVLFPGGFGTHDEGFEVLTLLQTGKTLPRPIVMVDTPKGKYWKGWLEFVHKHMLKNSYLTRNDDSLYRIVYSVDAAVEEVAGFYRTYHSIAYGKELTVIRLNSRINEKILNKFSKKYKDILADGGITPTGPLPFEVRNKLFLHLPRIGLPFDKKSYPRLIALIRDINKLTN
ncbi:MAG: LOG family protein [Candidatus Margulisbacteria bacterium]|nr:LOG family protein [Candidatus Margulisiibacteriota bacterium]